MFRIKVAGKNETYISYPIHLSLTFRTATGYGLDGRGSIPSRDKIFLFYVTSRPAVGPTQPPIQCVPGAVSPGVKRQGREADHSSASSAEVKNGDAIPVVPHIP
jgi:hypothetical protein